MSEENGIPDSSKAEMISNQAKQIASQMGHRFMSVEHLMLALLQDNSIKKMIVEVSGEEASRILEDVMNEVLSALRSMTSTGMTSMPKKSQDFKEVMEQVAATAVMNGTKVIGALDIMRAISEHDNSVTRIFKNVDIDPSDVTEWILSHEDEESLEKEDNETGDEDLDKPAHIRVLEKFCINLSEEAGKKAVDPVIGREEIIDETIVTLSRRYKKNVNLVGPPGTGKTAIVEGLASKISSGDVPEQLKNATVWELDSTAVVAGAKFRGDMEERLKNIIKALEKAENPILFIDEIHTIIGAGESSSGGMDMANILKPALARGKFKCIGATTDEEYRKYFEKDKAMVRRFKRLTVTEPSLETTKAIIVGIAPSYTEFHGVEYDADALESIVDLTDRYITNKFNPDKSIDMLDAAGAYVKIRNQLLNETKSVTVDDIQFEVSKAAKIPTISVKEDETQKLSHLEEDLKSKVFDQDAAVVALSNAVLLSRSGLRPRNKTLGNYLMVGPSGTGKTETCKQLSETLSMKLVRLDMSEYVESHSVSKLIGSPPGYVGYGEGDAGSGIVINALEENPHCILLLDEIEKAHPVVYNLFLQVMDNGFVNSSSGKKVDATNVILIMTSNAGAASASSSSIGFNNSPKSSKIMKAVEATFTPEFRNRLDAIIEFSPLSNSTMLKIVDKFIGDLNVLSNEKGVEVKVTEAARLFLADKGYDPKMGARPVSRLIDSQIKVKLAKQMLFGALKSGGIALVDLQGEELEVTVEV